MAQRCSTCSKFLSTTGHCLNCSSKQQNLTNPKTQSIIPITTPIQPSTSSSQYSISKRRLNKTETCTTSSSGTSDSKKARLKPATTQTAQDTTFADLMNVLMLRNNDIVNLQSGLTEVINSLNSLKTEVKSCREITFSINQKFAEMDTRYDTHMTRVNDLADKINQLTVSVAATVSSIIAASAEDGMVPGSTEQYFEKLLVECNEGATDSTSLGGGESVGEASKSEVGGGVIKNESSSDRRVVQRQQQQQQLEYVNEDGGGDVVGVLEAGQPEIENGALVEPTGAEAVTIVIGTVHEDDASDSYTLHHLGYQSAHQIIHDRAYLSLESPRYKGIELREGQQQQQQVSHQQQQQQQHHHRDHHHHHHHHSQQQYAQLGAGEVPVPEGGDNRHPTEASVPPEGNRGSSHMPHSTMHRYGTETLSPTDHQQHHLSDPHQHSLASHRHLEDHHHHHHHHHHQDTDEDVERVSGIAAAMRGARGDFNLGVLFPTLASNAASNTETGNGGGGNHHHHLEDVLPEDAYLQHQIRAPSGGGGGGANAGTTGGGSPPVRTGSSPGSSRSPHEDQGLSSPHRHGQTDDGYSPNDQGRLQSFTHLTAMQPPSVQTNHSMQDDRVSDQLYMESIYTHHSGNTPHHHQDHDQGPSTPHSPSSSLYRTMSGVGAMTGGTGTSTGYSLPYMTNSPTELTASPQQLWTTQGLATSLPAISEDYCSSKSTATVTHQTLPAFSQPFGSRPPFRGYSPPYSSQQTGAGTGSGAADAGNATSWTYTSADALASPYGTVGTTSRRQASNTPTTPSQPQLSAAATLTANFTSNDDNTTHDGN